MRSLSPGSTIKRVAGITGIAIAIAFGGLAGARAGRVADLFAAKPKPRNPIGDTLPDVQLHGVYGKETTLKQAIGSHPSLIMVTSLAECASCSNLPLEMQIVRKEIPGLVPLLIGGGASAKEFQPYFRKMHVDSTALIDEPRALLTQLGSDAATIVLLADSTGRILFVDSRQTADRAQYPLGRILNDMSVLLRAARPAASH